MWLEAMGQKIKGKTKTGCVLRTHPAKDHIRQRYVQQGVPQVAGPASITALIGGVTEPAIYGILLKYKKPLIMVCIANAVGGAICGAFNVTRNVQMSVNLLTLPAIWAVYGPWAIVAIAVVCVLVFALVWLFGYKDEMDNVPEKESK